MQHWNEVRKAFPKWKHPMWQYVLGFKCDICDTPTNQCNPPELRIVEGFEHEKICRLCYWSKHVWGDDYLIDEEIDAMENGENDVFHVDDLPPEVMTDGRGNTTLDNW